MLIDRFKKYKQAGSHSNSFRLTNGRSDDTGKTLNIHTCICVNVFHVVFRLWAVYTHLFILDRISQCDQMC